MSKKRTSRDPLASLLTPIATRSRVAPVHRLPSVSYKTNNFALGLIEDRRTYYPGLKPYNRPIAQMAVGAPARLALVDKPQYRASSQTKATVAFAEPQKLPICIRRETRKQVLHAKGVAGSKGLKKPTRNEWSDVSCRS